MWSGATLPTAHRRISVSNHRIAQNHRRGVAVLIIVALVGTGCDGEQDGLSNSDSSPEAPSGVPMVTATASSPDTSTAVVAPTTPVGTAPSTSTSGASTVDACPGGGMPAVGALDLASGDVRWSMCSEVEAYRTLLGATDDAVYVQEVDADGNAQVLAIDAARSTEMWRAPVAQVYARPPGPFAGGDVVVVELADQTASAVVGLTAGTGEQRWRFGSAEAQAAPAPATFPPMPSPVERLSPIAHTETVVVIVDGSGGLRGLDRLTGEQVWAGRRPLNSFLGTVALADEVVAIASQPATVGIDVTDGSMKWEGDLVQNPSAAEGVIVGGPPTGMGDIRALDASTGETFWSHPGRESYGGIWALGDGAAYVLDDTGIVAYDLRSGTERWRRNTNIRGEPQTVTGSSLLLLWEGRIGALSTRDGSTIWELTEPFHSPLMDNLRTTDSTVYVAINSLPWRD
jgi:outer membrane protein assembly factor BamB